MTGPIPDRKRIIRKQQQTIVDPVAAAVSSGDLSPADRARIIRKQQQTVVDPVAAAMQSGNLSPGDLQKLQQRATATPAVSDHAASVRDLINKQHKGNPY